MINKHLHTYNEFDRNNELFWTLKYDMYITKIYTAVAEDKIWQFTIELVRSEQFVHLHLPCQPEKYILTTTIILYNITTFPYSIQM